MSSHHHRHSCRDGAGGFHFAAMHDCELRCVEDGRAMRKARLHRRTTETDIRLLLTIEGRGTYEVSTGIRFFDHMLELFARHGGFDLKLKAGAHLDADPPHTGEDAGIAPGRTLN